MRTGNILSTVCLCVLLAILPNITPAIETHGEEPPDSLALAKQLNVVIEELLLFSAAETAAGLRRYWDDNGYYPRFFLRPPFDFQIFTLEGQQLPTYALNHLPLATPSDSVLVPGVGVYVSPDSSRHLIRFEDQQLSMYTIRYQLMAGPNDSVLVPGIGIYLSPDSSSYVLRVRGIGGDILRTYSGPVAARKKTDKHPCRLD